VRQLLLTVCICIAVLFKAWSPAVATEENFYKGKTITIVVGFGVGGGNDLYARLLARHIGKHIPGHPTVIVLNMPGAGSLMAVRHLDNSSAANGTVITTFQSGALIESIVTPDKINVDFNNYSWVGVANGEVRVCYSYGKNPVKSWNDLMSRKEFVLGTSAKGSASYVNGAMLRSLFSAPVKQVLGYPGANEQRLALERGELDGSCGSVNSIPDDWVREGKAHMFVRFSESHPQEVSKEAIYIRDIAKTDEQRQLIDFLTATDRLGRVFIMPKRVPKERIEIMRKAFDATMRDPDFLADAQRQQLPIDPLSGPAAEKVAAAVLAASSATVKLAREIYE
jgi:tripartite-type tricarboxylate transporter receptor subunit TctC